VKKSQIQKCITNGKIDMKTAFYSFLRNYNKRKTIYSITIGGFAISIAILFLIVSFIIDEKSFDKSFAKINSIYRIKAEDNFSLIPEKSWQLIHDQIPEIDGLCLFNKFSMIYEYNKAKNKDFTIWVIIAFVIACPISYYILYKWLESFAYKTPLSWWVFLLAGLVTLFISLLTVSWHSWKTSRKNPVEALSYE